MTPQKLDKYGWPLPRRDSNIPASGTSQIHNIDFPVFGYRVGVIFAEKVALACKYYFYNFDETTNADALHCPFEDECRALIFYPFHVTPDVIAHEAYHAVRRMLNYADIGLYEEDNEKKIDNETLAYHLGYLVREILKCQKISLKSRRDFYAKKRKQKRKNTR